MPVASTNNISRISMTGHMAGHGIRYKHDLGFSESGTWKTLNIEYHWTSIYLRNKRELLLVLFEMRTTSRKERFQIK